MKPAILLNLVLAINSLGFLGYLTWLAVRDDRIFYAQDGVLYLLPCIPFIFIFAYLVHAKRRAREEAEENT
jgi:hypothetical protein